MYDMMVEPPPPGSPVESIILLVWRMRRDYEYNGVRAIVQAAVNPDDGKSTQDAWAEYTNAMFPYLGEQKRRSDKAALDYLMKEVARGPLSIKPLVPLVKSRLHGRKRDADNNDLSSVRFRKSGSRTRKLRR